MVGERFDRGMGSWYAVTFGIKGFSGPGKAGWTTHLG